MLVERFNALRARLDALREGRAPPASLLERARGLWRRDDKASDLEPLRALDADLDRAGVHTVADARLLREVGEARGRLGALASGLLARAESALGAFEAAVRSLERLAGSGGDISARLNDLEHDWRRLGRVVKVAAVFQGGAAAPAGFEIYSRPRFGADTPPSSARLAVAEFLASRAQQQVADTARRRKDLDLAHEIVLRLGADAKHDRDRVRRLRLELGAARERVRSAPAVRSFDELIRHVRHAARRDPRTAYRSLRSLYERAVEAGDAELADRAHQAVRALVDTRQLPAAAARGDALRSLGWREARGVDAVERLKPGGKAGLSDQLAAELAQLAYGLNDDQRLAMELAAGCARYFDVEDALSEEIVEAETGASRPVQRRVPYPTQLMTYEPTNSLDQLQHFVLERPQALILELAAGRQLVRTYLEEEPPPKPKRLRQTAVRVYVLDASGSMYGARARFRDAILIAELNAIRIKARAGLPFDPLYFSFFNDTPSDLVRVDSGDEAARQIDKLFRESPAEGQTDISFALMGAFDSIGRARGRDPYLARATVVLVTDGEDGVDMELIRKTRRPYEGLDIAMSFISLGEENPDLKALVLEQREGGGRAFYHHVSDAEIRLARTEFDSAWRTLLPPDAPIDDDAVERLLPHLEALEHIAEARGEARPQSLEAQYDVLFPERPPPAQAPEDVVKRLTDVLEAVGEAIAFAPLESRRGEAVTLLLHLLQLYGVTVQRYQAALGAPDEGLRAALGRIRLVC
jgi:hypothetical protein